MKDQPLVEDIRITYYKHDKVMKYKIVESIKSHAVEIIVVVAFIAMVALLIIYGAA